ncbi:MAG: hypothetical protein IJ262_09165 [Clostridia bacterium]|nr:hypothetical protein [Clostridia bacterium]
MILEAILNSLKTVLKGVLGWINIPALGEEFEEAVGFFDTLLDSAQDLINLFLPWDIVRFGMPLIIIVTNFEHLYDFVMWILKKIPVINIK